MPRFEEGGVLRMWVWVPIRLLAVGLCGALAVCTVATSATASADSAKVVISGPLSAGVRPGFTEHTATISTCTNWARVDQEPLACFSSDQVQERVEVADLTNLVSRNLGDDQTEIWDETSYVWDSTTNVAKQPPDPLPALKGSASSFGFLGGSKARPAHYSRCTPISWGVDLTAVKSAGLNTDWELARLKLVVSALAKRTGQKFRYIPNVTVRSRGKARPAVSNRLASSRQSLAISFGTPTAADRSYRWPWLAGAGGYASPEISGTRIRRAHVVLNTTHMGSFFDSGITNDSLDFISTVYLHEIMHAMGLAHVNDRSAIMNPAPTVTQLSRGDIAGLSRIKAQRCS